MQPDYLDLFLQKWISPVKGGLPRIYVVGGAVRDHVMGRPFQDVDLVCRNAAGFARRMAENRGIPTTVVPFTRSRRTPCFRVVNRHDPEDHVDVVELRGSTIEADLAQRDFTVNALAVRVGHGGRPGPVVDCCNGRQDIRQGLIRVCAPSAFSDDPLRILRAARLAAGLDFQITPETVLLMQKNAARLTLVAPERVTAELMKLLDCPRSLSWIRCLDEIGALTVILPEIAAARGCLQNDYHHLDVWEHSLEALSACEAIAGDPEAFFGPAGDAIEKMLARRDNLALLKLAALLHDAGKPRVKRFDTDRGRVIFHGHARRGAEIAADAALRMRLSNAQTKLLTLLVRHHMRPVILSQPDVKKSSVIKWFQEVGDPAPLVMILAVADVCAKSGEKLTRAAKDRFFTWARQNLLFYLENLKETLARPNLVNGQDLIDLGMAPGPDLGKILAEIRKKQDLGELTDRNQALAMAGALMKR